MHVLLYEMPINEIYQTNRYVLKAFHLPVGR